MNASSRESSIVEPAEKAGRPLFTPSLGSYAAIRMDPAEMVRHLDSKAIEEAAATTPKTYLVYLMMARCDNQLDNADLIHIDIDTRPAGPWSTRPGDAVVLLRGSRCRPLSPPRR